MIAMWSREGEAHDCDCRQWEVRVPPPPPPRSLKWGAFIKQATTSLMKEQAAAVAPVLELFLNSPQNLEIRTRCHRILMRLIESEPFTTSDPSERYGLSRRLLAIDPARFPDLTKHLAELRRLSVNPSTNTPSSNVGPALQAAGLRFEQNGNRTTIWIEDSWNQNAEAL